MLKKIQGFERAGNPWRCDRFGGRGLGGFTASLPTRAGIVSGLRRMFGACAGKKRDIAID